MEISKGLERFIISVLEDSMDDNRYEINDYIISFIKDPDSIIAFISDMESSREEWNRNNPDDDRYRD